MANYEVCGEGQEAYQGLISRWESQLSRATLEVLVGMIASGKSTYAKMRAAEGAVIINDDAIVLAVHGGDYSLYQDSFKPIYKGVELSLLSLAASSHRDVIVDNTNLTSSRRSRWAGLAHAFDYRAVCTHFPKDSVVEHAWRRYKSSNRGISAEKWFDIANRHDSEYECPSLSEGFDFLDFRNASLQPLGYTTTTSSSSVCLEPEKIGEVFKRIPGLGGD
jgi:predicted kinase